MQTVGTVLRQEGEQLMKNTNRWIYMATGVVILLLAGLIYAWSVFSVAIAREFPSWSKGQLALVFTVGMMGFCIGGFLSGLLLMRVKVRYLLWLAGGLLFTGMFLSSRVSTQPALLLSYGVFCGLGSGMAYNSVISTVNQWFADKQGLSSGLLLMGFGTGAFIIGKLFQLFTAETAGAWRSSSQALGLIILAVFFAGGLIIRKPQRAKEMEEQASPGPNFTPGQMLMNRNFWFFIGWSTFLPSAGLILISHASGIALEAVPEMTAGTMSTTVGLISIFNGMGRVFFGGMHDRSTWSGTIRRINLLYLTAAVVTMAGLFNQSFIVLTAGFILTGFAFGGITPTNSTVIARFFGTRHFSMNFPILNLNVLVSSLFSPMAGLLHDRSGSYHSSFYLMLGLILAAASISLLVRQPESTVAETARKAI